MIYRIEFFSYAFNGGVEVSDHIKRTLNLISFKMII